MHQRPKLLLVDRHPERAARFASRLAHLDIDVTSAHDGASALLRAHAEQPDVIVAGDDLPILDGFRMLDALRSQPATEGIPVILLTENDSEEALVKAWEAGADLCVPRSQGEAEVIATLHRAVTSMTYRDDTPRELLVAR